MAVTILIADDHNVVRVGIRALLGTEASFKVVGEASDGLEALRLAERLMPDVLLLDLTMPGLGGIEIARQVRKRSPRTRILVLSMHDDDVYVLQALRAGAAGYLLKDSSAGELVGAVLKVAHGGHYLSPPLAARGLEEVVEQEPSGAGDLYDTLSDREREVLQLIVEGNTSAQIAGRLFISRRTVEDHRAHIKRKLHVTANSELIRFALERQRPG